MYRVKAGAGARIGAYLLDCLFIYSFSFLISFLFSWTIIIPIIVAFLGNFLYFGITEGCNGSASLGKRICGLIVVDEQGMPITTGKAFGRAAARYINDMTFGIGYIIGLASDDGRTIHDRIAGTFVADKKAAGYAAPYQAPTPGYNAGNQQYQGYNTGAKIIGVVGQYAGQSRPLTPHGLIMGRDSTTCQLVLSSQSVSRNHCKIEFNPNTRMFILHDLGSSYGTYLGNGTRVPQGQPVALRPGDEFYLASRSNTFRVSL